MVHSRCLSDEVMGLLASKYLKHWDVRFWALQCVSRAAAAICDDPGAPGSDGGASQGTAKDDVACTMFDVLRSLPASLGDEPVAWTRGGVPLEAGNDVSGSGRKRCVAIVTVSTCVADLMSQLSCLCHDICLHVSIARDWYP